MKVNSICLVEGGAVVTIAECTCGGIATFAVFEPEELTLLHGARSIAIHLVRKGSTIKIVLMPSDGGGNPSVALQLDWWDVREDDFIKLLALKVGDGILVGTEAYSVMCYESQCNNASTREPTRGRAGDLVFTNIPSPRIDVV